jgi:acyl-coenzyme A synthetase/AMP-(fatty) acid ligase
VLSSAVIGLEDDIKGMKPYAFVVLKPNYTVSETELKDFLFDTCPSYQVPRNIWFLEEMILTGSNKIDKNALIAHAKTLV